MEYHVSSATAAVIVLCMVLGVVIPLALFFWLNRKKKASPRPFLIGWLGFLIAVTVLERLFHALVLNSSVGAALNRNLFLYALYGGITAGLFEELTRYLCFSRILKKEQNNDWNALMYGAGHGGSEMFNLFTILMANNLIYAVTINSGGASEILQPLAGDALLQMQAVIEQLCTASPALFLLSLTERIFALSIHLSLSVLVFYAAKGPAQNRRLLLIAVELHALVDFIAVISSALFPAAVTELIMLVMAAGIAFFARMVWRQNHETSEA